MRRLAAAVLLLPAVWLSSCGGSAEPTVRTAYVDKLPPPQEPLAMQGEVGSYGGRFVIAGTSGPETFNPVVSTSVYSADIAEALFIGLTQYRLDTQERTPSLASSWSCADDAMSCTFHLRRGAAFSDGHPITAEDVVFSSVNQNHQYDAVLMAFSRGSPEVPSVRLWQSTGRHPWQRPLARPLSPEQRRVDELARQIVGSTDFEARKRWLLELGTIVNQQAWVIWVPVAVGAKPVRNGFGNMHPSGLSNSASGVLWNAEEIFVKPRGRATN